MQRLLAPGDRIGSGSELMVRRTIDSKALTAALNLGYVR
jgi:hypothetical protein